MNRKIEKKSILVIEEDAPVRNLIIRHLSGAGYETSGVAHANDAFRAVAKAPPDIIICDVVLNDMDGFDVCRRLRTFPDTALTPVLMVSPGGDDKERQEARMVGAQAFLVRPFRKQSLLEHIRTLLSVGKTELINSSITDQDEETQFIEFVEEKNIPKSQILENAFAEVYEEMATLYDLSGILYTLDNEHTLLEEILNRSLQAVNAKAGAIFTVENIDMSDFDSAGDTRLSQNNPVLRVGKGFPLQKWMGYKIPLDTCAAGWVWKNKQFFLSPDISLDERALSFKEYPWESASVLAVPICSGNSILGVIVLANKKGRAAFNQSNAKLLKAFATHLFFALENIRFLEAVKETETRVKQKVEERTAVIEQSRSVVSRLNDILEKKLYELSCMKELQMAVASLFDPLEIFHEAMRILNKVLGIYGAVAIVPEKHAFLLEGNKSASTVFWNHLIEEARKNVPRDEGVTIENWEKLTTGLSEGDCCDESELRYFNMPVYIQNRFVLSFAMGRPAAAEMTDDENSLITMFAHQFGLYMDGALLFMKTKELDQMKSEFISVASHELRTPMASIKSALSLFADELLGPLNEEQKEYITLLERNVNRLATLISDVLDFSRIESGRIQLELEKHDVSLLINDVARILKQQFEERNDTIIIDIQGDDLQTRCDYDKITQVLINLTANAINHNTDNTQIGIGAKKVDKDIQFWVIDDGCGIPESEQEKIYDKFYQIHSNKGGGGSKGTGLGLAITKGLVEAHGSKLLLESEVGKGTRFSFDLESADAPKWKAEKTQSWNLIGLGVTAEQYGDRLKLSLKGRFEEMVCADMSKIGKEIIDNWGVFVVVELSGLEYIVSRGIGYIMELRSLVHKAGGNLVVLDVSDNVRKILEPMGILKIIPSHTDLATAFREVGCATG
ncbi:MAG: response regulator [Fibrobacteria bacterium]|nr:response regulator [Fibrobacteria bacterium]